MKKLSMVIAAAASIALAAASGQAQGPSLKPLERPTISPYLNLLRGAETGTLDYQYYRQFRPFQRIQRQERQFQQSLRGLEQRLDQQQRLIQSSASGLSPTGRRAGFMTHLGFFGNAGAGF